ncbi:MAG: ABC transporter ATP-binding protein [Dehalococcoidales bacterium]|nr:ABC transporter ATP-binding protein [Dehalococcoidales bacterium]
MAFIQTVNLGYKREGRDILKNVNLAVEKGETHALIGPTGAGKTTFLRLIDMLDMPGTGKIFINGVAVSHSEKSRLEIRRRMAFVLQKPVVFNLSVYDNVAYGLKWRGLKKHVIREKVNDILETVELVKYSKRNARTLSGGEMQRVAIARAIATGPEILLLDEPSANLDPVSAAKIEDLISGIIKQNAITVLMSTHDMEQGQRLADRISVLIDGEIVQTGNAREVFTSPKNREVAEFVGMENIIDGEVISNEGNMAAISVYGKTIEAITEHGVDEKVSVCIRPEDVTVSLARLSSSARNVLEGTIIWTAYSGPLCRLEIDCGFPLVSLVTRRSAEEMDLKKGLKVFGTVKAVSIHVIARH